MPLQVEAEVPSLLAVVLTSATMQALFLNQNTVYTLLIATIPMPEKIHVYDDTSVSKNVIYMGRVSS